MTEQGTLARRSSRWRALGPGLLLCFTVAAAASFLAEHYGAPAMLFALLIGMAFHFLADEARCSPGVEFTASRLLRIGVALLGARVTLEDIMSLGLTPVLLVVGFVVVTVAAGLAISRLFGRGSSFGLLTGGAVAICGASAALAIAAVLPQRERLERDTLFTVIAVTTLSTIAMVAYPVIYTLLGFDHTAIGILLGATIHDVAQVVGAGYAVSPEAGIVATYVKLLRVAMLPVVVIALAFVMRGRAAGQGAAPMPWFAAGFAALLLANSAGLVPAVVVAALEDISRWLLVAAISALGVKTSIEAMLKLGPRHIFVVVAETVFLFAIAVGALLAVYP